MGRAAHQLCELRQLAHNVLPVAVPVCAGVAYEEELPQVVVSCKAGYAEQACLGHKVEREVQLLQRLAALQVLHLGDVVDSQVQVLQVLQAARACLCASRYLCKGTGRSRMQNLVYRLLQLVGNAVADESMPCSCRSNLP